MDARKFAEKYLNNFSLVPEEDRYRLALARGPVLICDPSEIRLRNGTNCKLWTCVLRRSLWPPDNFVLMRGDYVIHRGEMNIKIECNAIPTEGSIIEFEPGTIILNESALRIIHDQIC